jgi:hypothetical protein
MEFTILAGSEDRARAALTSLWATRGHSMSFEHALVAEVDGRLAGVVIGFPAAARYRLHFALLRQGVARIPLRRRILIPPVAGWLVVAAPRPPRDGFYVAAIAVGRLFLRRGVATALFDSMGSRARRSGLSRLAGHTGLRHAVMRSTAEAYGFRASRARRWGYVLYELELRR